MFLENVSYNMQQKLNVFKILGNTKFANQTIFISFKTKKVKHIPYQNVYQCVLHEFVPTVNISL
jgi:hypothetical protein